MGGAFVQFLFSVSSRRVAEDPVPEHGYPCADAREIRLSAPNAPADDAPEEPAAVASLHHQWAAGVALEHMQTYA